MEGEGDGEGDGVEGKAEGEGGLREGNEAEKESRFTAELKGEEDEEGWGGDGGWGGGEWGMIHVGDDGTPEGESSREDKTAQSREKPLQNELQKTSTPPEKKVNNWKCIYVKRRDCGTFYTIPANSQLQTHTSP